jgi:Reverse transcriptase (RNA-dependent DNA polymerase)
LELGQIDEYITFIDKGHNTKVDPPSVYKRIIFHLVYDVKHDGRHKARLVADGNLTDIPLDSEYSGVVSLQGFQLILFSAELNGLQLWAPDIGNAYLEAYTTEKVYIIAGPGFGEREGHILVISKLCTVYVLVAELSGTTDSLIVLGNSDSSHVRQNQTSG